MAFFKVDRSERIGLIDQEEMEFDYKSTDKNQVDFNNGPPSEKYPPIHRLIETSSEESEDGDLR